MPHKNTENLFFIIILLVVFTITTSIPVDNDMWWHLRAGDEMWKQGRILLTDEFSFTRASEPWVNAFWLSDLGLYGVWKLGGFFAIVIVVSLIAVGTMWIVHSQMDGNVYLRGLLILLATIGASANWTARPQLLSFVLLAVLDHYLTRHVLNGRTKTLWILIPIFLLWGNLHGGFIWGMLLLLATIVGEMFNQFFGNQPKLSWSEIGRLGLWSTGAMLAVLINPNGVELWKLPFQQVDVSLSIQEWLSPDFHQFYAHPTLWLLFLLIFGLGFSGRRISFTDLFKGLGFAYLFFVAQRNMGPYCIIITPIVAKYLSPALENLSSAPVIQKIKNIFTQTVNQTQPPAWISRSVNFIIVSLLAGVFLTRAFVVSLPAEIDNKVPAQAAAWIKENQPRGPIFNSYNWGGYLTWSLREYPVFIDGRADLYGNEIINEWNEISRGTDRGFELLDEYQINLIFLEPYHALLDKLPAQEWEKIYSDPKIVIYQRIP
jgi:hypothetical protein